MSDLLRQAQKRMSLIPNRQPKKFGQRTGSESGPMAQAVGDVFYKAAVEVVKPVYTAIDARYAYRARLEDATMRESHAAKMDEARKILNEKRNDVLEAVLPLFEIRMRKASDPVSEADGHAHDYMVNNLFVMLVRTLVAYVDQFVTQENTEALERTIEKVASIQGDLLTGQLMNFAFSFRPLPIRTEKR